MLKHHEYDRLEHAVNRHQRIAIFRRGTEYIVIPLSLESRQGREVIEARNPTTGDTLLLYVDELDSVEALSP